MAGLSDVALMELMAAAGREVMAAERALAKQGFNVVGRLLRDEGPFYAWDHYPAGDVRCETALLSNDKC